MTDKTERLSSGRGATKEGAEKPSRGCTCFHVAREQRRVDSAVVVEVGRGRRPRTVQGGRGGHGRRHAQQRRHGRRQQRHLRDARRRWPQRPGTPVRPVGDGPPLANGLLLRGVRLALHFPPLSVLRLLARKSENGTDIVAP